ncbi:MAG: hypothetical protein SFV18_09090 [Bryobacteraceae bacterium]|nr:hypothetical protein [Bryobacteraceae bacterium]
MARGWESKDVESQMEELRERSVAPPPTAPEQARRESERASLTLSRKRVIEDLKRASHERHRAILQASLDHLDSELRALDD